MKQPAQVIHLEFSKIAFIRLESMDCWLKEYFEIDIAPYKGLDIANADSDIKRIAYFGWRVSHLANALLQAIRIPCFDPGYILKVTSPSNTQSSYQVSLLRPAINHMPLRVIPASYKLATQVLLNVIDKNQDDLNSDQFFEDIQVQFINPGKNLLLGGASTIPILNSAYNKGIPFHHLGFGIYQLGWGSQLKLIDRSSTELDSVIGAKTSQNKFMTNQILKDSGLPVPRCMFIRSIEDAIQAAHQIQFPVVIKPADRDRGEGITINIDSDASVMEGYKKAAEFSKNILVEKQIPGTCHRIFVANYKHLFTVRRMPKSVTGDGILTVEELIKKANARESKKARHKRLKSFPMDELAMECIMSSGFSLDSIPGKNVLVPLRKIESTEWGGTAETMTETIHPDNIRLAIQAAKIFKLNMAGIDLMSIDVRIPWHQNGAAINEINYAPFLSGNSQETKKVLSEFLDGLFPSKGRIPVEVFIGDDRALKQGLSRLKALNESGIESCLTTHQATYKKSGEIYLAVEENSLFLRCRALLMNPEIEAIILVVQTDEFAYTGLPVDSINKIVTVSPSLTMQNNPDHKTDRRVSKFIMTSLKTYLRNQA